MQPLEWSERKYGRSFSLTPLGELLRTNVDGSLAGWAAFVGRPYHWESWANLLHSVQTGENAFHHLHGRNVWEFREEHPDEGAIFDRAMTSLTGGMTEALLESYDFGRFGTVVDVGGGNGVLLAALLQKHPQMQGVLFDDPGVVSGAEGVLREMGVVERCELVGGSFFEAVPEGGDAYILKSVIHDWEDEDSVRILRVCRDAMSANATLLVPRVGSRASERRGRPEVQRPQHARRSGWPRAHRRRVPCPLRSRRVQPRRRGAGRHGSVCSRRKAGLIGTAFFTSA